MSKIKKQNPFWSKKWMLIWILLFLISPPIVGYLIEGPYIFSSVSHYFMQSSIGYAYGIIIPLGNIFIGKYFERLDWSKNPKRTNLITFSIFMGFSLIMGIGIPYFIDRFLWGMSGISVFYDVSAKAFMTTVIALVVFYFYNTNLISNHWIKSIEKNEELKRENLQAKYEALKNQVNPHFLFNSLNTLSGLVEQKPDLATDFIRKLSDIYRYVLEQTDKELVSIKEEMKFIDDYVFLLQMRFGKGFLFDSKIDIFQNMQVVPLSLQMLIENAIKHNAVSDDMPLKIEMKTDHGFIVVTNNIQRKRVINNGMLPLGLENIKKRYAYLSNVRVEVIESENEFIVKLPVIEGQS